MNSSSGRFPWCNPFLVGMYQRSVSNWITTRIFFFFFYLSPKSEQWQKRRKIKQCLPGILMGIYCGHHLIWHPNHGNGKHGFFGEERLGFLICMILKMGTRLGHARTHIKLQISKSQFHSGLRLWITLKNRINIYVNECNKQGNSWEGFWKVKS